MWIKQTKKKHALRTRIRAPSYRSQGSPPRFPKTPPFENERGGFLGFRIFCTSQKFAKKKESQLQVLQLWLALPMESWTLRTFQQQLGWQRYGLEKMANSCQQGPWFWRIQKLRARISNPRSGFLVSSSSSSSSLFSFTHLGMKTRKTRRRRGGRTDCRVLRGGDGVAHAHVNNNKEIVTPGT